MAVSTRRLQKELTDIKKEGPPVGESPNHRTGKCTAELYNISGIELLSADDFATWYLTVEVLGDTVYQVRRSLLPPPCHSISSMHPALPVCRARSSRSSSASTASTQYLRPRSSSS